MKGTEIQVFSGKEENRIEQIDMFRLSPENISYSEKRPKDIFAETIWTRP
jgi:hypothetical protein